MARKPKSIYVRIENKRSELELLNQKIEKIKLKIVQLEKEKDTIEMQEIFKTAKENNLNFEHVIKLILKYNKIFIDVE